MDSYLLYYAFNILLNNVDWPNNNLEAWFYNGDKKSQINILMVE